MKKLLVPLMLLATATASAASDNTPNYYMYSPKAGGHEFMAGVSLLSSERTTDPGAVSTKGSGLGLNLEYAYGFSQAAAFYVEQRVYNFKQETAGVSSDIKLMSPTTLGIKGFLNDKGPYFFYNATYTMALLEKRDDADGLNVFFPKDLRDHVNLGAGFALPVGSMMTFGLKADYQLYQDSDLTASGVTVKLKSGSGMEWKGFAQFDIGPKLGLAYGNMAVDSYDSVFAGITSSNDKTEYTVIQLYGIVGFGNTDLLFDVQKWDPKDKTGFSKNEVYVATVGAKMNF